MLPPVERRAFLAELLPKLTAYHSWLYTERDPKQNGLVTLIHPWESGLDTSPPWMRVRSNGCRCRGGCVPRRR